MNHVKFGHFVNSSYIFFGQNYLAPKVDWAAMSMPALGTGVKPLVGGLLPFPRFSVSTLPSNPGYATNSWIIPVLWRHVPRLHHWSSAALDYPPSETEPFLLSLLVSGTVYPGTSLLRLRCLSSGHVSRLIFLLTSYFSHPSPRPCIVLAPWQLSSRVASAVWTEFATIAYDCRRIRSTIWKLNISLILMHFFQQWRHYVVTCHRPQ